MNPSAESAGVGSGCSPAGVTGYVVGQLLQHYDFSSVYRVKALDGDKAVLEVDFGKRGWIEQHVRLPWPMPREWKVRPVEEKPKPIQAAPAEGSKNPRILGKYTGSDLADDLASRRAMDTRENGFGACLIDGEASAKPARLEPSKRYGLMVDIDGDIPDAWEHVGPRVR